MDDFILFESSDLLPESWRHFSQQGPVRVFNPGLLRDGGDWIFAYRVVGPDSRRRIGICRLDHGFRVMPGTQTPLSDGIRLPEEANYPDQAESWFADPRLFRLGSRVHIYWNSGWHDPQNHQFINEIDSKSLRLKGPPRELRLAGERRTIEKNWGIFGDGPYYAVYSATPQRVLKFSPEGVGDIDFKEVAQIAWNNDEYTRKFGGLRGGAPPQRLGDHYFSFCHSVSGPDEGYRYGAAVYRFSAIHPFSPTDGPVGQLPLPNPFGANSIHERLNPAVAGEVIYVGGAAYDGEGRWVVAYGINDEHCAIARLPQEVVLSSCAPLTGLTVESR
jgi:hypothetical protein